MAEIVYSLCAMTSVGCAVLLFRGHRRSRAPLLLWSALCFVGLSANNILLVVDYLILRDVDLTALRSGIAFAALLVLIWGAINAGGGRAR
jgi:hypothetical protein